MTVAVRIRILITGLAIGMVVAVPLAAGLLIVGVPFGVVRVLVAVGGLVWGWRWAAWAGDGQRR